MRNGGKNRKSLMNSFVYSPMQKLFGVLAPTPTFINEKGAIDFSANLKVCEQLQKTEISGLWILGTTGEWSYFTTEERKAFVKFLLEQKSITKPMVICANHWRTDIAVDLAKHAAKNGAKYISSLLPLYFQISDEGIKRHFREIRKGINEVDPSIPFFMYHIPIFTSTANIKAEIVAELANEGTIQGIKDSTFEVSHPLQIFEKLTAKEFNYFCGTELLLLAGYREGNIVKKFDGGIFSGADVLPNTYSRLFKAAVELDKLEFFKIWPVVDKFTTMWKDGVWYLPHVCKFGMKHLKYEVNDAPCAPLEILNKKMKQNVVNAIDDTMTFWGGPET